MRIIWICAAFWLVWVLVYFTVGLYLRRIGMGSWIYKNRWGKVLWLLVLPVIVVQVPMIGYVFDFFHAYFQSKGGALQFPTAAFTIPLWPIFLLLWYIRDQNKEKDIKQAQLDLRQNDFHQLQEWVGTESNDANDIALRVAAIHQLKRYLTGEIIRDDPEENELQIPTLELLKAVIASCKDSSGDVDPIIPGISSRYYRQGTLLIIKAVADVFRSSFIPGNPMDTLKGLFSDTFLCEMNLTDADLSGADLSDANLSDADLAGANLSGADLNGADLVDARLTEANLSKALVGANLSNANLTGANLSGAYLGNLSGADLSEANLSGAVLSSVMNWKDVSSYKGANISGVKNAPEGFREHALSLGAIEELLLPE